MHRAQAPDKGSLPLPAGRPCRPCSPTGQASLRSRCPRSTALGTFLHRAAGASPPPRVPFAPASTGHDGKKQRFASLPADPVALKSEKRTNLFCTQNQALETGLQAHRPSSPPRAPFVPNPGNKKHKPSKSGVERLWVSFSGGGAAAGKGEVFGKGVDLSLSVLRSRASLFLFLGLDAVPFPPPTPEPSWHTPCHL